MMETLPHRLTTARPRQIGLVVLQSDETIELEFRRMIPGDVELMVSRVASGEEVTPDSLAAMEHHMEGAAALFPPWVRFSAIGYGCTSGTAQIGAGRVAELIGQGARTDAVTNPVTALVAACRRLGVSRLGMLSPYVAEVSGRLRDVLAAEGIATPVFGSFEVAEEAKVARLDAPSIQAAAERVAAVGGIDALFLSCTNLRALDLIHGLEARLGLPVMSSNQVLAWHLMDLARVPYSAALPGQLFANAAQVAAAPAG